MTTEWLGYGWRDYDECTELQQATFRSVNPLLANGMLFRGRGSKNWSDYQVWLKRDGAASRKTGHWQWTSEYEAAMDREIHASRHHFTTGNFTLDRS